MIKIVTFPLGLNHEATKKRAIEKVVEFEKAIINIMDAVLSIHANNFAHCDIRWPNVIFDSNSNTYLLIDFEMVQRLNNPKMNLADFDAILICSLFNQLDVDNEDIIKKYNNIILFAATLSKKLLYDEEWTFTEKECKNAVDYFWHFYIDNCKLHYMNFKQKLIHS